MLILRCKPGQSIAVGDVRYVLVECGRSHYHVRRMQSGHVYGERHLRYGETFGTVADITGRSADGNAVSFAVDAPDYVEVCLGEE